MEVECFKGWTGGRLGADEAVGAMSEWPLLDFFDGMSCRIMMEKMLVKFKGWGANP